MLKQLETFGECRGKTIMDCDVTYNWGALCITFTDETFVILKASSGDYEGDDPCMDEVKLFDPYEEYANAAVSAGALTEDELKHLKEEKRRNREALTLQHQRQQYEHLKAIFEKEDKS